MWKQHNLEPLMTELRTTREKLLAIGSEHLNEKQVKALPDTEASMLADDIGSQDGIDYLVMERVEGETLAKRLQKGALPLA